MKTIAVLLTCYNRAEITLRCLRLLFAQQLNGAYELDVWLVDDASPDRTGDLVKSEFPQVNIIHGTGGLFWAGGMRLAWERAAKAKSYDFYLWLNDDVALYAGTIAKMLNDYERLGADVIVCGALLSPEVGCVFYGSPEVRGLKNIVEPILLERGMHGNVVLIPKCVYERIGGMAPRLVHQHGDFEYGFRARQNGVKIFAAGCIVGECAANYGFDKARLLELKLVDRIKMVISPKGLGICDYFWYKIMTHRPIGAIASCLKGLLMGLCPKAFIREVR